MIRFSIRKSVFFGLLICFTISCREKKISQQEIDALNLKTGEVALCGSGKNLFGTVNSYTSVPEKVREDFNKAVSLLHSFEYDEAEKTFAKVIETAPNCAMAYWGVALSNFHLLWAPPNEAEIQKGIQAINIAKSLVNDAASKESDLINAAAQLYLGSSNQDHHSRRVNYEKAMEKIYLKYPADKEAAIFYSLALRASADPLDKTFKNQLKAGAILDAVYPDQPNHPGIAHYIIHTYDYPELADRALVAARKYASIAPALLMLNICLRTFLYDLACGMNVFLPTSPLFHLQNALQKTIR